MPEHPDQPEKPIRRRDFFRRGLMELFKPLDRAMEPIKRAAQHFDALDRMGGPAEPEAVFHPPTVANEYAPVLLRPPGALPEADFLSTCSRCGECVRACPVLCIKMESTGFMDNAPYIDVDAAACVMCEGLQCT